MSNIKESNKARPMRATDLLDFPRFPIKAIRFKANDPQELPGKHSCSSVTNRDYVDENKRGKHNVDYIPQIRHYLITFHDLERSRKVYTLVHESVPSSATLPEVSGPKA